MARPSLFDISKFSCIHRIPFKLDTLQFEDTLPDGSLRSYFTAEKFSAILYQINADIKPHLQKARNQIQWQLTKTILLILGIIIVNVFIGIGVTLVLKDKLTNKIPLIIGLVVFTLCLAILVGCMSRRPASTVSELLKKVVDDVNLKLEVLNKETFQSSKMAWSLVGDFDCIKTRQSTPISPSTYIPIWIKKSSDDPEEGLGYSLVTLGESEMETDES
jgi:hypothetical protein